jgi:cation transport ATPase
MSETEQTQQITEDWEVDEDGQQQEQEISQQPENEKKEAPAEKIRPKRKKNERKRKPMLNQERSNFVHGLSAGLGIGCIAAFIMLWLTVFFTPQLPAGITYEAMLSQFIYPLIYLFALGLISLTVGIVGEQYAMKSRLTTKQGAQEG